MKVLVVCLELFLLVSVQCGYLDQLVKFYRTRFLDDVKAHTSLPRIEIQDPPPGYQDEKELWDLKSARRLVVMLRRSGQYDQIKSYLPTPAPKSGRRQEKIWDDRNDLYYDSDEYYDVEKDDEPPRVYYTPIPTARPINEDQIIYVANPVEARLPGHSISIRLLKEILTARAFAALLPTTTKDSTGNKSSTSKT